ncbi:MAG: helix-turn-helix transcriptional regulator [Geminicoccaceae bacterium]|nr:helix-turn-helix transcriptional regulator [Geminicoccaceae bacterium]
MNGSTIKAMEMKSNFGRNVRKHCTVPGSIARICRKAGINRQQFNKYLNGHSLPSLLTAQTIANALGVRIGDLLEGDSDRRRLRNSLDGIAATLQPSKVNVFAQGYYLEVNRSEVVPDHVLTSLTSITFDNDTMRYRRKTPLQSLPCSKTLWTYDGVAYNTNNCGKIIYVNSTVRLYFGSYLLESASLYNKDLVGLKLAGSSNPRGTPFAAPVYKIYLGERPNLLSYRNQLRLIRDTELPQRIAKAVQILDEAVVHESGMLKLAG